MGTLIRYVVAFAVVALAFVGSGQAQQLSSPLVPFASTPIDPSSLIYLLQPVQFNNWQSTKTTIGALAATIATPCSATAAGQLPPTGGGSLNILYSDCTWRPPTGSGGITQLTGQVLAGPGTGTASAILGPGAAAANLPLIGAHTSGFTADGAQVAVQTSSTTVPNIIAPYWGCQPDCFFDAVRGVMNVPPGGVVLGGNAIGGYVLNNNAGPAAGVGIFTYDVCNVPNCQTWGSNFNVQGNDHPGELIVGSELDLTTYRTDTQIAGISLNGSSTAQPTAADGMACGPLGSGIKWVNCFVSNSGAAIVAMIVGANAPSGTNISSEPIRFSYIDGSGNGHFYQLAVDINGQFDINVDAGNTLPAALGINRINIPGGPNDWVTIGGDSVLNEGTPHLLGIGSTGVTQIALGNFLTTSISMAAPLDGVQYLLLGMPVVSLSSGALELGVTIPGSGHNVSVNSNGDLSTNYNVSAGGFVAAANVGVSCSGINAVTYRSVGGITTHC